MSFLDKLKVKIEQSNDADLAVDDKKDKKLTGFLQLDVDIYQNPNEIIIVAPIPGVEMKDLDITIENENDVITIQGKRESPLDIKTETEESKYLRRECQWGQFYRQIILPQEVNVGEVKAVFHKGILYLTLPLLRLQTKGKKKIAVQN